MVSVPITQQRSVQVQPRGNEKLRYAESRDLIGPAVEQFGNTMGRAAEGWDQIEATYDEADATRIANEGAAYERERLRTGDNAYLTTQGFDAGQGREAAVKDLHAAAQNLLVGARSQRARGMAQRALSARLGAAEEQIAGHAVQQMTVARNGESEARIDGAKADFLDTIGTDQAVVHLGVAQMEMTQMGKRLGWGDDRTKVAVEKLTSGFHKDAMDGMLASADPDVDKLTGYLDAHGKEMQPGDREAILKSIQQPLQARQADSDFVRALSGGEAAPAGGGGAAGIAGVQSLSLITPPGTGSVASFMAKARSAESSGNPNAKNTRSSAQGLYQFTDGTWLASYRKHFGAGESDAAILAKKNDAGLQETLMNDLTNENKAALQAAHIPITDGNLYLAHFAGSAGAKKLHAADPDTPVGQVLGAAVMRANPFLQGKSAADTIAWAAGKMGSAAGTGEHSTEAPREWDKDGAYNKIDALAKAEGWSFERVERTKRRADQVIARDEDLLKRQRDAADDEALKTVMQLGDGFKSLNQLPRSIRDNLSPQAALRYTNVAEQNSKPKAIEANGPAAMTLNIMRFSDPEKFKTSNLAELVGRVTPAELDTLLTQQASMRAEASKPDAWNPRQGITAALNYGATIGGLKLDDGDKASALQIMEAEANQLYRAQGNKPLTETQYQDLFRSATRKVRTNGVLWGHGEVSRYDLSYSNVPDSARTRIAAQFKKETGRDATPDDIVRLFRVQAR